ncbi:MAG: hypothetical protein KDB29_12090 [Planctomycetes bacterium]|nr:hypothetical protein [Planctomycetota bacterium]
MASEKDKGEGEVRMPFSKAFAQRALSTREGRVGFTDARDEGRIGAGRAEDDRFILRRGESTRSPLDLREMSSVLSGVQVNVVSNRTGTVKATSTEFERRIKAERQRLERQRLEKNPKIVEGEIVDNDRARMPRRNRDGRPDERDRTTELGKLAEYVRKTHNPPSPSLMLGGGVVVGSGDVEGPSSSTDNAIARYDGTTGKTIQNSGITISDESGDAIEISTAAADPATTISIKAGDYSGSSGNGGDIELVGGDGVSVGSGGGVTLKGGSGGVTGSGGGVSIEGGSGSFGPGTISIGASTAGSITIGAGAAFSVTIGNSGITTTINGTLALANDLAITHGGTGASTEDNALSNLIGGATARDSSLALDSQVAVRNSGNSGNASLETALGLTGLVFEARLSPSSTLPVPTSNASSVGTLYLHPYNGGRIALYNTTNSRWEIHHLTSATNKVLTGLTSGRPYDVFLYDNSGALTLEFVAWSSTTARSTALTTQNGVYVKSGDASRRYVGTFYTTASNSTAWVTDGGTTASPKLFIWNFYNRKLVKATVRESTGSWVYATNSYRYMNNNSNNRVECVIGFQEDHVIAEMRVHAQTWNTTAGVGIGEDTSSSVTTPCLFDGQYCGTNYTGYMGACLKKQPTVGYHYYAALEIATFGSPTFWGSYATSPRLASGVTLVGMF